MNPNKLGEQTVAKICARAAAIPSQNKHIFVEGVYKWRMMQFEVLHP